MGCCSSIMGDGKPGENDDPVKKLGNLIGDTEAPIDLEKVPQERRSMTEVEISASRKTIYYQKKKRFEREGSLNFDEKPEMQELRGFLAEPLGRFYLLEYAKEKKLPEMEALTLAWTLITKIESLLEVNKEEDDDDDVVADADDADTRKDAAGSSIAQVLNPDTVFSLADAIIEQHLTPGAPMFLDFKDGDKCMIRDTARKNASKILEACVVIQPPSPVHEVTAAIQDISSSSLPTGAGLPESKTSNEIQTSGKTYAGDDATRAKLRECFVKLRRAIFREMFAKKFGESFKEHSEYQRYQAKFDKVYNAISHRDFDFMQILGKGSFGRVFRIRKKTTGRQFALKIMSKKKILSGAENAAQVAIERNVLVMCDCSCIVRPYFAFQTNRALFLALELLEGGNLIEAMDRCGGKMSPEIVRFLTAQMSIGLMYLHDLGILYRDLKPLNVMIDRRGNAVLTDMGLCVKFREATISKDVAAVSSNGEKVHRRKSLEIVKPNELKCVGTYGFRAPELLDADKSKAGYGPSVDYWALGVTVFYILEGKAPYKSRNPSLMGPQKTPKELEKDMHKQDIRYPTSFSPDMISLISGLLDKDPNTRLGSDRALLKAHPIFKGIDWDLLAQGKLQSPFNPGVRDYPPNEKPQFDGLAGAMAQFSMNDNVLELFGGEPQMEDEYKHVGRKEQKLFRNWGYSSERELALEWDMREKRKKSKYVANTTAAATSDGSGVSLST